MFSLPFSFFALKAFTPYAESEAGVQVTVEYRSERGYAAKALARRWSERRMPPGFKVKNAKRSNTAAAQRPTYGRPLSAASVADATGWGCARGAPFARRLGGGGLLGHPL